MNIKFNSILLKNMICPSIFISLIPVTTMALVAFFFRSIPFILIVTFLFIFLIIYFWKYFFRSFELNVILSEEGIFLKERKLKIMWGDIKWFVDNSMKGSLFPSIVLKLKSGAKINIIYFPYKKEKGDDTNWDNFSKVFFKELKEKNPDIMTYYDSKNWDILIYSLYGLNIVVPVAMLILRVKPLQFMATWFTLFGFSISLISTIRNNRSTAKHYKTYKEIQEEKKLKH